MLTHALLRRSLIQLCVLQDIQAQDRTHASHESDEGGPSIAALHCEQCEDSGCNKVQDEYSG